jgi:hypothetical protein
MIQLRNSGTILILTKDNNNISVVDQVGFLLEYSLKRKNYIYQYEIGNENMDEIITIKIDEYNNG